MISRTLGTYESSAIGHSDYGLIFVLQCIRIDLEFVAFRRAVRIIALRPD